MNRQLKETEYRPKGFHFYTGSAGLFDDNRDDVLIIHSETPCTFGAVFTKNTMRAAPVRVSEVIAKEKPTVMGVVANAGCANSATGKKGVEDAKKMIGLTARSLGTGGDYLVASTGLIGKYLDMEKIASAIKEAAGSKDKNLIDAAESIMTTDTFPKYAFKKMDGYTIAGITKGAGMICPELATTLAFVVTDYSIDKTTLQKALRKGVDKSYNRISVDGETSTNDCIFVLSNGESKINSDIEKFETALSDLLLELALKIVKDGEGATKLIFVEAKGFRNKEDAKRVAEKIGNSILVKTALAGENPNWGRIMGAAGNSGVDFSSEKTKISIGDMEVFNGSPVDFSKQEAKKYLSGEEIKIIFDAAMGEASYSYYTCDITEKYVRINSHYST